MKGLIEGTRYLPRVLQDPGSTPVYNADRFPIVGATLAVAQKGQVQGRSAEPVLSLDEGLTTKPAPAFMK